MLAWAKGHGIFSTLFSLCRIFLPSLLRRFPSSLGFCHVCSAIGEKLHGRDVVGEHSRRELARPTACELIRLAAPQREKERDADCSRALLHVAQLTFFFFFSLLLFIIDDVQSTLARRIGSERVWWPLPMRLWSDSLTIRFSVYMVYDSFFILSKRSFAEYWYCNNLECTLGIRSI